MSFTKKILDTVGDIGERILADDTPLTGVDQEGLQLELARRTALRQEDECPPPSDNPLAKLAGPGDDIRKKRKDLQARRRRKFAADVEREESVRKKAQDAEFRRIVEESRREQASRPSGQARSSSSSSSRTKSRRRSPGFGQNDALAKHYRVLNLPYGAPFDEVKSAYRKLMRKYHPDLHNQTPKKQKAATELTVQVSQAFNALEEHLDGGPNKAK